MRLLYVTDALAIHGGIERVLTDKLNWLVECHGYKIRLLLAGQGNHPIVYPLSPKVECHDLGIMFHRVYSFHGLQRYRLMYKYHRLFQQRLKKQILEFLPDIIVLIRLEYIIDVMKTSMNIPVIFESHSSCLVYKYEKISLFQRLKIKYWYHALKKVQMIVALTQGDALEWKKLNPHVRVIPNVVHLNDTGRYSDCCSKSVLFVGRYTNQKDIPSLLNIWKCVHQRYPDWKLHILGGFGGRQEELQNEILHTEYNIVVNQPTSYMFDYYFKGSLLLMTSCYEPFGLVLPEAMSCGLPVVAFDCPYGPSDIITDGVDGFLIRKRNVNSYFYKVCQLISNAELRRKMGQAGAKSSIRYNANNIMPQWKNLFCELISKYE